MRIDQIQKYLNEYLEAVIAWLPSALLGLILLLFGFWVVKRLNKFIKRALSQLKIDKDISEFLLSFLDICFRVIIILIAASFFGFKMSALFGLLAAAAFAIGLALQGFLGNFASGLTIIFFKPYSVGDWVEIGDKFGRVESIQIFNTILRTPNNKKLVVPNGQVTDHIITNISDKGYIHLELQILISYEESFPKIKQIVQEAISVSPYLIQDHPILMGLESYETHNIMMAVRPAVNPNDYWQATYDFNERIKRSFSMNDIKMAYSEGVELGPIGQ